MPFDDQRRSGTVPGAISPNTWSLLEYPAHHRMAALLSESEQERLAGLARKVRPGGSGSARLAAWRRFLDSAQSLAAAFARHPVIARPGRGAG